MENFQKKLFMFEDEFFTPIHINDAIIDIIDITLDYSYGSKYCSPHSHTWYEFNYLISGSMHTFLANKTFEASAGEFFMVSPGVEHAHRYNEKKSHEGICLRWQIYKNSAVPVNQQNSTYEFLSSLSQWNWGAIKDEHAIVELLNRMLEEAENENSVINQQLLFVKVLFLLAEMNAASQDSKHSTVSSPGKNIVRKVEKLLNDNLLVEIDVQTLAASLHMSYGYLARVYKKETGITLLERLQEIRIEKAVNFLENSGFSIKEIAEKAGFSNQYYFSRIFKERFGMSPSEYRILKV